MSKERDFDETDSADQRIPEVNDFFQDFPHAEAQQHKADRPSCATCRFARKPRQLDGQPMDDAKFFWCQRYPKQWISDTDSGEYFFAYPEQTRGDWCGEWQHIESVR